MTTGRADRDGLLLGEWACLGLLATGPAHGFALAARLRPDGDVGRVWSLSRALTYRAIDQLVARGFVRVVAEEPGDAGPNRTVLAITGHGRRRFRAWLDTPVEHLRDLRSELLLKLVLTDLTGVDARALLAAQRVRVDQLLVAVADSGPSTDAPVDVVVLWRIEAARAGLRFIDTLLERGSTD